MITERILQVIDKKGITKYKFCKDLGLSNGFLDKTREIATDKYANILEYFKDVNPQWLLTGQGRMIKTIGLMTDDEIAAQDREVEHGLCAVSGDDRPSLKGIPLIPIDAMAGVATGSFQIMEYECERYVVPMFKGAEFLISVNGDSMMPKYNSGDLVACKSLPLDDLFFQWNNVYVIDTRQGAILKRIRRATDPDRVMIVSENPNYEPFELDKSQINAVAIVVGVIRSE